jgi:hypothetical protein
VEPTPQYDKSFSNDSVLRYYLLDGHLEEVNADPILQGALERMHKNFHTISSYLNTYWNNYMPLSVLSNAMKNFKNAMHYEIKNTKYIGRTSADVMP